MEGREKIVGIRGKKYKSWPISSRREKAEEEEEEEGPCGKRGIPSPFPGGGEAMPLPIMVNASFNSPGRSVGRSPAPPPRKAAGEEIAEEEIHFAQCMAFQSLASPDKGGEEGNFALVRRTVLEIDVARLLPLGKRLISIRSAFPIL